MTSKTSMAPLVALIRGVNVGGKTLSMERLRVGLAGSGFEDVKTYIQSGNVVLRAVRRTPESVAMKIEQLIRKDFHLEVTVIVRTLSEMQHVISRNPFVGKPKIDESRLHVTFLATQPTRTAIETLTALPAEGDRFRHTGREIYLHCPDGYGKTKLSNSLIERVLATRATTRNWNTVRKLAEMARSAEDHR